MQPKDYIVIQHDFAGGTLVKLRTGMYARLTGKDTFSEPASSVRRLLIALEKNDGSQDTSETKRSTEDSGVQETGDRVVASDSGTTEAEAKPATTSTAKKPARKSTKK